ncbi:hypothetical protein M1N47_03415 [Dehalococcoidia bacterium]|nr:hypothetical protein [Dehalococcoidia bacterium]
MFPDSISNFESLRLVLSKLAENGKLPPEVIKKIYEGEALVRIREKLTTELGKTLDAYRNGRIDEDKFRNIVEVVSKLLLKEEKGEQYEEQEPVIRFTSMNIEEIWQRMHILSYYRSTLPTKFPARNLPFLGKRFLMVLHFTRDLLPFLELCEHLGLNPESAHIFWKPYMYPHREQIAAYLQEEKRYNIYCLTEMENVLGKLESSPMEQPQTVIVEDGGYIVPLLHSSFPAILKQSIGAVEQTARGIRNDRQVKRLTIPVMDIAEADLKNRIEPHHVADAVVHNLENLLSHEKTRGQNVALMGYGYIGREIASRLKDKMCVTIYDPRAEKRMEAKEKGFDVVVQPRDAVREKFLVVGCSGETSIGREEILILRHNTYLASATSDQKEIGLIELKALSAKTLPLKNREGKNVGTSYTLRKRKQEICLLADGYPVNFWFSESMPDQVSDLILSLILVSMIDVIQQHQEMREGIHCDKVNKCADKYELARLYESFYS